MSKIIDTIKNFIAPNGESDREDDVYLEYCPHCQAILSLQKGYDPALPYWVCRGCGEMLISPEVDAEDDIAWICDNCSAMLNTQPGFSENSGEWICLECGCKNTIDESALYLSEEEYYASRQDPYRGLSDEEILELTEYSEEERVRNRDDIILVCQKETGERFVKKLLTTYDRSIYEYLLNNPVAHMPQIIKLFESDNCLIVIEEYISGKTVFEMMEDGFIDRARSISITKDICGILDILHNLPSPIIHRDIKPSNIMITKEGETYLLDVNVARWYDPDKNDDTTYMGTQSYAAPEQAGFGLTSSSEKSDIYAVGMLLNVMLTGCFPKEKRADGRIWDVIERCISMDSADRYTAIELKEALEAIEECDEREAHQ